jgi:hypothetical protein
MRAPRRLGAGAAAILTAAAATAVCGSAAGAPAAPASTSIFIDTAAWPTIAISVVLPRATTTRPAVFENDVGVRVLGAGNVGQADTSAIAVDHSRSMRGAALKAAVGVAKQLLADRARGDRVAVFAIASRAIEVAPFARTPAAGEKALAKLRVDRRFGTALYDGVVLAADKLKTVPGKRKVIFLITDGQGTTGTADIGQAAAAATAANVSVYPVMIGSATYLPRSLRELSRATQGAFLGAETRSGSTNYAAIASDVRRTWRILYTTAAKPGSTITVKVAERGAPAVSATVKIPGKTPGKSIFQGRGYAILAVVVVVGAFFVVLVIARPPAKPD